MPTEKPDFDMDLWISNPGQEPQGWITIVEQELGATWDDRGFEEVVSHHEWSVTVKDKVYCFYLNYEGREVTSWDYESM